MQQINMLAIELPKGADFKGESSLMGSSPRSDANKFSEHMERNLSSESEGNSGKRSLTKKDKPASQVENSDQVNSKKSLNKEKNSDEKSLTKTDTDKSETNLESPSNKVDAQEVKEEDVISTSQQQKNSMLIEEEHAKAAANKNLDITTEVNIVSKLEDISDKESTDKIELSQEFISLLFSADNMLKTNDNSQALAEGDNLSQELKATNSNILAATSKVYTATELEQLVSSDETEHAISDEGLTEEILQSNKLLHKSTSISDLETNILNKIKNENVETKANTLNKSEILPGNKGADFNITHLPQNENQITIDESLAEISSEGESDLLLTQMKASGLLLSDEEQSVAVSKSNKLSTEQKTSQTNSNNISTSIEQKNQLLNSLSLGEQTTEPLSIINEKIMDVAPIAATIAEKNSQGIETDKKGSPIVNQATNDMLNKLSAGAGGQQSQEQSSDSQNNDLPNSEALNADIDQSKQFAENEQFSRLESGKFENKQTSINNIAQAMAHNVADNTASESLTNKPSEAMLDAISSKATAVDSTQTAKVANLQNETISIYRKDFADAVKDKVMVMINQKLQQVEIRLDPQELGHMHIRVNLQNEQAAVNFIVQNQQAKEALEQNMGKLKDMLAQSGVDVGDANIEQNNSNSGNNDQSENSNGNRQASFNNESSQVDSTIIHTSLAKASSSAIDYYA